MLEFLDQYGYFAILVGTFFEGETVILLASSLTHTGLFEMPYTIFFGFAGSFISDWIYYLVGRLNGKYFISKRPKLNQMVLPVSNFFHKHKIQILFSYRFLYGLRVIIPVVIGMSGLPPMRFFMYSLLSGIIWATTVGTVGYWIGEWMEIQAHFFEENILFIMMGFATFGLLVGFVVKRFVMKEMDVSSAD